ncbi:MAG: ABC transporter substrate-binding protein [Alphaproteobacteria bacterium]|nr:ABC transporter substrate-binding protein [Alphaproteobacteria bacterium]
MKIGLMISRRGPGGLWAFTCDACAMLAAAELNAAGGVLGRPVELVAADAGGSAAESAAAARDLIGVEAVDAIVARHPSDVRPAIIAGIAGRVPYVYASMYEGGAHDAGVLPIGGTDAELLGHAIPLLMAQRRASRFFLLGNDRLWPRCTVGWASRIVAGNGGRVVGVDLLALGLEDYAPVFARIVRSRPDVVLTMFLGDESVRFNRAFAAAGLSARLLRLEMGIDETILYGGGADAHENLYVATTYVAGTASGGEAFAERYREGFGAGVPPATVFGRSCYDGVHLLARLAGAGRRPDAAALRRRFARLSARHASGLVPRSVLTGAGQALLAEARGLELKVVAAH